MNQENVTKEGLYKLIEAFPTRLRRNLIAVTLNTTEMVEDGLTETPSLDENQFVVATGDLVRDIEKGDRVGLNLSALTKIRRMVGDSDQTISEIDIKLFEFGEYTVGLIDERVVEHIYL